MNIADITQDHYDQILRLNTQFVHWLSPLNQDDLEALLGVATYAKQINDGHAVLIGYRHDVEYDHKNLRWLRARFNKFHYIDRVIVDDRAHGQGLARLLYDDFARVAHEENLKRVVCEVNTKPDNPGSHAFHLKMGFKGIGDKDYPDFNASVRYYEKPLTV